jgi:hypothetical protein
MFDCPSTQVSIWNLFLMAGHAWVMVAHSMVAALQSDPFWK